MRTLAFSPDGRTLASGSRDNTIRLWDVDTGRYLVTLQEHKGDVETLAFSPDGRTLASGGNNKTLELWDTTELPRCHYAGGAAKTGE